MVPDRHAWPFVLLATAGLCFAGSGPVLTLGSVSPGAGSGTAPRTFSEDTMHFDGDPDRGFNIAGTYTYGCAARFTAPDSLRVLAILYYLTGSADEVFVHVSDESTQAQPSQRMLDTTRSTGQGGGVWRRANMPQQPVVVPGRDFWTCVIIRRHPAGQYPLTLDLGPIVPWRGGYITLPSIGPEWYQLTDPPFWTDRNVNIRAVVEHTMTGTQELLASGPAPSVLRTCPNPFRAATRILLPETRLRDPELTVHDASGRLVRTLVVQDQAAAWNRTDDSGRPVPAGVYVVLLRAGTVQVQTRLVAR